MNDLFITGTFRNNKTKNFNKNLEARLFKEGFSCYLPQRDTEQKGDRRKTFSQNISGIDKAKLLVAIKHADSKPTSNWGFEIGYAYKSRKPVIIIANNKDEIELMIEESSAKILKTEDIYDIERHFGKLTKILKEFLKQ